MLTRAIVRVRTSLNLVSFEITESSIAEFGAVASLDILSSLVESYWGFDDKKVFSRLSNGLVKPLDESF